MQCLANKRVCVSGTMMAGTRQETIALIRRHGGVWDGHVTRQTDVLVIHPNEMNPPTRKVATARRLGVKIVYESFLDECLRTDSWVDFDVHLVDKPTLATALSGAIFSIGKRVANDLVRCVLLVFVFAMFPWRALPRARQDYYTLVSESAAMGAIDVGVGGTLACLAYFTATSIFLTLDHVTSYGYVGALLRLVVDLIIARRLVLFFLGENSRWPRHAVDKARYVRIMMHSFQFIALELTVLAGLLTLVVFCRFVALHHVWRVFCVDWEHGTYIWHDVVFGEVARTLQNALRFARRRVCRPIARVVRIVVRLSVIIVKGLWRRVLEPILTALLVKPARLAHNLACACGRALERVVRFMGCVLKRLVQAVWRLVPARVPAPPPRPEDFQLASLLRALLLVCVAPWRLAAVVREVPHRVWNASAHALLTTAWDSVVLDWMILIVLLFILVTVYRVPELVRRLRAVLEAQRALPEEERQGYLESLGEAMAGSLERERAFLYGNNDGNQQRGRWLAVAERRRRQREEQQQQQQQQHDIEGNVNNNNEEEDDEVVFVRETRREPAPVAAAAGILNGRGVRDRSPARRTRSPARRRKKNV